MLSLSTVVTRLSSLTTLKNLFQVFVIVGLCSFVTVLVTEHSAFVYPVVVVATKKHDREFARLMTHALYVGGYFTRITNLRWPPSTKTYACCDLVNEKTNDCAPTCL